MIGEIVRGINRGLELLPFKTRSHLKLGMELHHATHRISFDKRTTDSPHPKYPSTIIFLIFLSYSPRSRLVYSPYSLIFRFN